MRPEAIQSNVEIPPGQAIHNNLEIPADSATPVLAPINVANSAPVIQQPVSIQPLDTPAPSQDVSAEVTIASEIKAFLDHTPNFEMVISGTHVLVADTNVSDTRSSFYSAQTWDFSDGTTLTILGILTHTTTSVAA